LRIISGHARGKKLATFSGRNIRPTSDKVREALFSILYSRFDSFVGKKVLDLYAGTGALSLEAISRGCENALLIDEGPQSSRIIPTNISACGMEGQARYLRSDVSKALSRLDSGATFDLIFIDPPYGKSLAEKTIRTVSDPPLLAKNGIICVETGKEELLDEMIGIYTCFDKRIYGSTAVHFFCHSEEGG